MRERIDGVRFLADTVNGALVLTIEAEFAGFTSIQTVEFSTAQTERLRQLLSSAYIVEQLQSEIGRP